MALSLAACVLTALLAAYADAKLDLPHERRVIRSFLYAIVKFKWRFHKNRTNIYYRLEESAHRYPTRRALWFEGKTWTWNIVYEQANRYAAYFQDLGVQKGDIIAIDITNCPEFIWAIYGLYNLGACPAFLNFHLESDRLIHCVKAAEAKMMIIEDKLSDRHMDLETKADLQNRNVQVVILDDRLKQQISGLKPYRAPDVQRNYATINDLSAIIFTSGTSGLPKACAMPIFRIFMGSTLITEILDLTEKDTFYCCMPLYHSVALILGTFAAVNTGTCFALSPRFSASRFWHEICDSHATVFCYVGETCRYLLSSPPSPFEKKHDVRVIIGNGMRPDVWQQFKDRFDIPDVCEFYGATESPTMQFNYQSGDVAIGAAARKGAITKFLLPRWKIIKVAEYEGEDIPIRNESGRCIECKPNEIGELVIRMAGRNSEMEPDFAGYLSDSSASTKKIVTSVSKRGDRWYRSGDLFKLTSDGNYMFIDRLGDSYRWHSENVSALEVEDVVGKHPGVDDVAVYGVQVPKHEGRAGMAAVVLKDGVDKNEFLKSFHHDNFSHLPKYASPVFVRFIDHIDYTGTNKKQKSKLKKQGLDCTDVYVSHNDNYVPLNHDILNLIDSGRAKL